MRPLRPIGPEMRDSFLADRRVTELLEVDHWIRQFDLAALTPTKAAAAEVLASVGLHYRLAKLHVLTRNDVRAITDAFPDSPGAVFVWHRSSDGAPIVRLYPDHDPEIVARFRGSLLRISQPLAVELL